jgi:hypothetical protein
LASTDYTALRARNPKTLRFILKKESQFVGAQGFPLVRRDSFCVINDSTPGGILSMSNPSATAHFFNAGLTGLIMRTRNPFIGLVLITLVIALAGCGAGIRVTNGQPPPPVTGAYTNASLNGSYAFLIRGTNTGFFSVAGSFQANGAGMITAGTEDINSPGTGVLMNNVAITGTYTVLADGRTTATITSPAGNFAIDFVLLSDQHGLAMRFNNSATAIGTVDLQVSSGVTATTLQGSFAFSLYGADHVSNFETTAGAFTTTDINNADAIQTGVEDFNDNGVLSVNRVLTGSLSSPVAGRGVALFTTNVGALNFVYYIVDTNHLILIETDTQPALAGDAFRESGALAAGTQVLTLSGASGTQALAAGAILNLDANNNVLTTSTEDANKGGAVTQNIPISGTYSVILNGRQTITLAGSTGLNNLAAYPTTGGTLLISIDAGSVATGVAFGQSIANPSKSSLTGRYGFSLAGSNTAGTVDAIAQFTADGNGNITGNLDENSAGSLGSGMALTGTYTLATIGRGTAALSSSAGSMNLIFYMIDAQDFIYLDVDTGQVATGRFQTQQ